MIWVGELNQKVDDIIQSGTIISKNLSHAHDKIKEYKINYKALLDKSNQALTNEVYHRYYSTNDSMVENCNGLSAKIETLLALVLECRNKSLMSCLELEDIKSVINHGRMKNGLFGLAKNVVDDAVTDGAVIPDGLYREGYEMPPTVFRRSPSPFSSSSSSKKKSRKTKKKK